jgi:ribosomal protein S18 acetylase RimI-like enzyme
MNIYIDKKEWVKGKEYSDRINKFLKEMDLDFIPNLSSRVIMDDYAEKLATYADTLFLKYNNEDIASCSVYCNYREAFISSIGVKSIYKYKNLGKELIQDTINHVITKGCSTVMLDVNKKNFIAIKFYEKCGFYSISEEFEWIKMKKRI